MFVTLNFKSKPDLKHYTEGHDAIDSGKTFHVSSAIILVKHLRDWQIINKYIRTTDVNMQGVMLFTIIGRNCLITKKGESLSKFVVTKIVDRIR